MWLASPSPSLVPVLELQLRDTCLEGERYHFVQSFIQSQAIQVMSGGQGCYHRGNVPGFGETAMLKNNQRMEGWGHKQ